MINNKYYIGITRQSIQNRWRRNGEGYRTQPKFYQAIQKYGWNNFEHKILYEKLTAEEASLIEQRLIVEYDSIKNGYNISPGGTTTNHSQETKEKIRQSLIGKHHTEETKALISKTKQEQSGKKVQCIETGIIYNSMGEAMKETGVDKSSIRKACKGEVITAGNFHWKFLDSNIEIPQRKDKRKKAVICLNDNKIYQSVSEAARITNSDFSNIAKVCNGKYKSTNGLKWKWLEDYKTERYNSADE